MKRLAAFAYASFGARLLKRGTPQNARKNFFNRTDFICPIVLIAIYFTLLLPIANIYPFLTTDDMGRDLYAFQMALQRKIPCRDYWWQYGPLMPIYYAFWFLVSGINLVSAKIGLAAVLVFSALFTYQTVRVFVRPMVAFLFSLTFLSLDTGYTFNHVGCFPFLILLIFSLWKFFLTRNIRWCYVGICMVIGVSLVKITSGIACMSAFLGSLVIERWFLTQANTRLTNPFNFRHCLFLLAIFIGAVVVTYGLMYLNLPLRWIDQCLTAGYRFSRDPANFPWPNPSRLWTHFFIFYRRQLIWNLLFIAIFVLGLVSSKRMQSDSAGKEFFGVVIVPFLFGMANSMDYFIDGAISRIYFWLFPFQTILMAVSAELATILFKPKTRILLGGFIFFLFLLAPLRNIQVAFAYRTPERYLEMPHGRAYIGGHPYFVKAIREANEFIRDKTTLQQEILALPDDPLFSFLSNRRHATREINFYQEINIQGQQEDEVLDQLEKKQVPFVVCRGYCNRTDYFGQGYLEKLTAYISNNYRVAKTFRPWKADPPLTDALVILERTSSRDKP